MPAIDTARMRQFLDEIEAEAKEAESQADLVALKTELEELKARVAQLPEEVQAKLAPKVAEATAAVAAEEPEPEGEAQPVKPPKKKTRPGRKRGQMYQDGEGEPGYIWDQEDEPDEVEIEEAA